MDKGSLKEDILFETDNLKRLNEEMKLVLKKIIPDTEQDFINVRAAGSVLHDFYCGLEKIFERIAVHIDGSLPEGLNWHKQLLLQMAAPFNSKRPAIISQELADVLKEFMQFRHLFRHIYGFELRWTRFNNLAISMDSVLDQIFIAINHFLDNFK